jgi:putative toxin-antitoxin system antitoxin component (TIGR02293 family)
LIVEDRGLSQVPPVRHPPHAASPPRAAQAARASRYRSVDELGRLDRIETVRGGVPARTLTALADDMAIPREQLFVWLGLSRATANRKIRDDALLNQDESERTLGLARLLGAVERIAAESGAPEGFDAPAWAAQWLQEPVPALGGRAPAEFLSTADGRAMAASLILQMQSGAYA